MPSSKYKKIYAKRLEEHGKSGRSFASFCAEIGICRAAGYKWIDRHEDFREAKELFDTFRVAMLEDIALEAAAGRLPASNFNALKLLLQSTAKEYKQNALNGDEPHEEAKAPTQLNITFREVSAEEALSDLVPGAQDG